MRVYCSLLVVATVISLSACAGPNHWKDKATLNERVASEKVGTFSDDDRRLYHLGLQHIINKHQHAGAFTIGQVVDEERSREAQRAEQAQNTQEAQKAANGARTVSAACDAFWKKLNGVEGIAQIVKSANCRGQDRSIFHVDVTIRDEAWTSLDYDQRLRLAKSLWEGAVGASRLNDNPDAAHVRLIGEAGEELGGSNSFAGSMIDVSKE